MGGGIGTVLADKGITVRLKDINYERGYILPSITQTSIFPKQLNVVDIRKQVEMNASID